MPGRAVTAENWQLMSRGEKMEALIWERFLRGQVIGSADLTEILEAREAYFAKQEQKPCR